MHELIPSKIMMFHAVDDPYIPYPMVKEFAERTGIRLKSLNRGGHIKTEYIVRQYWATIREFFLPQENRTGNVKRDWDVKIWSGIYRGAVLFLLHHNFFWLN
jgi:hypothetical protein